MMGLVRALQIGPVLGAIPPGCAVCDACTPASPSAARIMPDRHHEFSFTSVIARM